MKDEYDFSTAERGKFHKDRPVADRPKIVRLQDANNGASVICAGHVDPLAFARLVEPDDVGALLGVDYDQDEVGCPTERIGDDEAAVVGARQRRLVSPDKTVPAACRPRPAYLGQMEPDRERRTTLGRDRPRRGRCRAIHLGRRERVGGRSTIHP